MEDILIKALSVVLAIFIICGAALIIRFLILKRPAKHPVLLSFLLYFIFFVIILAIYRFVLNVDDVLYPGIPEVIATIINIGILSAKGKNDIQIKEKEPKAKNKIKSKRKLHFNKRIVFTILIVLIVLISVDVCCNTYDGTYIPIFAKKFTFDEPAINWYSYNYLTKDLYISWEQKDKISRSMQVHKTTYQAFDNHINHEYAYGTFIRDRYSTINITNKINYAYMIVAVAILLLLVTYHKQLLNNKKIKSIFSKEKGANMELTRNMADVMMQVEELIVLEKCKAHQDFMKETEKIIKASVEEPRATALLQLIYEATEKVCK